VTTTHVQEIPMTEIAEVVVTHMITRTVTHMITVVDVERLIPVLVQSSK
jgi:hypothetical protein